MRSRKERWLLALLVLRASNTPIDRQWLAGTLWPNAGDDASLADLRRSLRFLRDALGSEAGRITSPTPRALQIDLTGAACDVTEFDLLLRHGDEASLSRAVDLYQGPLLLGCLEEWVSPEREAREQAAISALERLADLSGERGDYRSSAGRLGRVLDLDPLRETAVRGLMNALASEGRHAATAETFRNFRQRLHRDMHAEPDPETARLYRRILQEGRLRAESGPTETRPPASQASSATAPDQNGEPERRSVLPTPITTLIGREVELDRVVAKLSAHRLVTITGPGGVGKTRLAVAAAARVEAGEQFADGVHFFRLAPLVVTDVLAPTLTGALLGGGAADAMKRFATQGGAEAPLLNFLRDRQMLLVWDNCEHLVDEAARLAMALLQACPGVRLLTTSRHSLRLPGEVIVSLEPLQPHWAAELFAERAAAASGDRVGVAPNSKAVVRICRRVEGLPLALEMAAAWTRVLSPGDIAARLDDNLRLLMPAASSGLVRRQTGLRRQTLEQVFDVSFRLLEPDEVALMRCLVCFSGGWALRDAARMAGDDELATLDTLARLVDKSLVHGEPTSADGADSSETRFDMLEMVAQCARDRAQREAGAAFDVLRNRHQDMFLELVEAAAPHLVSGPEQMYWMARLDSEQHNIRTALQHSSDQIALGEPEGAAKGLRIAAALHEYWRVRAGFREASRWLGTMIAAGRPIDPAFPEACNSAAWFAVLCGDLAAATRFGDAAFHAFGQQGNLIGQADTLYPLGYVAWLAGNTARSTVLFNQRLSLLQKAGGDSLREAASHMMLAYIALETGSLSDSFQHIQESAALCRLVGNTESEAWIVAELGRHAIARGDFQPARQHLLRALETFRSLGVRDGERHCLAIFGDLERDSGSAAEARIVLEQALRISEEIGNTDGMLCILSTLADVLRRLGDLEAASLAARRALRLEHELGCRTHLVAIHLSMCGIERESGDLPRGMEHALTALRLAVEFGYLRMQVEILEAIATVRWVRGDFSQATRLFAAAAGERTRIQTPLPNSQALALPGRIAAQAELPNEWAAGLSAPFADIIRGALDVAAEPITNFVHHAR
jgi:predicted ATPase/DNA-binding SARP family transcriptional activator